MPVPKEPGHHHPATASASGLTRPRRGRRAFFFCSIGDGPHRLRALHQLVIHRRRHDIWIRTTPSHWCTEVHDGTKTLEAVMYMLPPGSTLDTVPDVGGPLTQWHIHDNLCFSNDPVAPHVVGLTRHRDMQGAYRQLAPCSDDPRLDRPRSLRTVLGARRRRRWSDPTGRAASVRPRSRQRRRLLIAPDHRTP